jgi:hypothetical protein
MHGVGLCAFPIKVHPSLSSYATIAASWGTLRSQRILQIKSHIRPTSQAAINSALVDERATIGWNFVLYAMVPPVSCIQIPLNDRRVLTQDSQSESPYMTAMLASCWG